MTMLCYSEFLTPRSWKCFDSQAMEFNYNQSSTSMKYIFVQILPIYMVAPKKYLAPKSTYCNVYQNKWHICIKEIYKAQYLVYSDPKQYLDT